MQVPLDKLNVVLKLFVFLLYFRMVFLQSKTFMVCMVNIIYLLVGELLVGFQDVAFLSPSQACFTPHFLDIVVDVKASGPPHVLILWLG